jgi:hypothetical protein
MRKSVLATLFGVTANTSKRLYAFKCNLRHIYLKQIVEYDPDGDILYSGREGRPSFSDVVPGSVGESMLNSVCRAQ